MRNAVEKANILSQALPYIQKYNHKIIVVKYGGNAMENEVLKKNVIDDIVLLSAIGIKVVLVHGGGPTINHVLERMNKEVKFINGLRYTDEETMNVAQMVLAGDINKNIVSLIHQAGANAVGISGLDAHLIEAKKLECKDDLGYVGEITNINEKLIFDLLDNHYIPVIASVGCDQKGQSYNINADMAAASIASKLLAENMVLVSNIPGLLLDENNDKSLLSEVKLKEIESLKNRGIIKGGMIPKVNCCIEAIKRGVKKTCIIDGRVPHSLLIEILSDEGIGTMFLEDENEKF